MGTEFSNIHVSNVPNSETSDSATRYLWRRVLKSSVEKINICLVKSIGLHHSACTADCLSCIYICYVIRKGLSIYFLYSHQKLEDTISLTSKEKNPPFHYNWITDMYSKYLSAVFLFLFLKCAPYPRHKVFRSPPAPRPSTAICKV